MTAEDEQARTLLTGRLLTAQIQARVAERELNEMGIENPSLFDVLSWLNSSRKQKEHLAYQWAEMQAVGEPQWKKAR